MKFEIDALFTEFLPDESASVIDEASSQFVEQVVAARERMLWKMRSATYQSKKRTSSGSVLSLLGVAAAHVSEPSTP